MRGPLACLVDPKLGALFEYDEQMARSYDEIKRRWDALFAWAEKGHSLPRQQVESWRAFSKNWEGWFAKDWSTPFHPHDRDALRAAANDLAVAEGNAQLQGYSSKDVPALTQQERGPKGAPMSPAPVHVKTLEEEHPILTKIDEVAPRLPATPPPSPDPPVPLPVRLAALFTLAATSVAATVAMKSDSHRAAAAAGGVVVTSVAAWAMLWPSSKEEKKTS